MCDWYYAVEMSELINLETTRPVLVNTFVPDSGDAGVPRLLATSQNELLSL